MYVVHHLYQASYKLLEDENRVIHLYINLVLSLLLFSLSLLSLNDP